MKKYLISILGLLSIFFIFGIQTVWAVSIDVTEKVPGANCSGSTGNYTCSVGNGFSAVMSVLWEIIKYFTYISALGGVLFIVINGILYSMSWINEELKSGAKDRIMKTLIGLLILMTSWLILNAVAPWVYK